MPYVEWKEMGFSKGTLHYMKQNARSKKLFSLNGHIRERLDCVEVVENRGDVGGMETPSQLVMT
ncbi:hypothetical protein HNV12_20590 [Methanococcoides sp. SA1]|nr:hypothetical protein [Methanococcoides sp. SA1]